MFTDKHRNLLSEGVMKLRTAIFSDLSSGILKFPTCLITVLRADKNGNIWFTVTKPYADMSGFNKKFFTRLQFYNKNCNYYIIIEGVAAIIVNPIELPGYKLTPDPASGRNNVLIRLKIAHAVYYPGKSREEKGLSGYVKSWFRDKNEPVLISG